MWFTVCQLYVNKTLLTKKTLKAEDGSVVALAEDQGSDTSTHKVSHNHPQLRFQGIWHLLIFEGTINAYVEVSKTLIHIKYKK